MTMLAARPQALSYRNTGLTLQIPSLDVAEEIVTVPQAEGSYPVEWLGHSVGLLEGSRLPGAGITVLTGHNHLNNMEAGPFALLETLTEGDRIFVTDPYNRLQIFEVYMNTKISEFDFAGLYRISDSDAHSLTLITCEDERVDGGYDNRRIIAARPINQ